jgi:glycosyltransferase involved in cell wall biosynthesis
MEARSIDMTSSGSIVVVGSADPYDVRLFSGTTRSMTLALEAALDDVVVIRKPRPSWFAFARKAVLRLTRGKVDLHLSRRLAKRHAATLRSEIAAANPRAVVSIANSALTAELGQWFPVIHVSDTTFDLMRTFYATFSRLGAASLASGEAIEQAAISSSRFTTVSSPWAARSVCDHYAKPVESVRTISWGCNIPHVPASDVAPDPEADQPCRLLFIGLDWERKGGDIVLETAAILRAAGFACHFDLVGALPDAAISAPNVTLHGLLKKSDPAQFEKLLGLLRGASILFLPTRQDCTPMVFAEANALGVPALASDVGGVSGVITHGENGVLLPSEASAADFAQAIAALWEDRPRYLAMRKTARAAYDERLNWSAWAKGMAAMIAELTRQSTADHSVFPNTHQ